MRFYEDEKTPYKAAQVIQKSHHVVLSFENYVYDCKDWRENPAFEQTWIGFKKKLQTSTTTSSSL